MAQQKRTVAIQTLKVSATKMVKLSIVAGNTHIASSILKFKGTNENIAEGKITNQEIGIGSDLVGKTLRVVTTVTKQGPTQNIVLTHQFTNTTPSKFQFTDVFNPGNLFFTYVADYNFTN